MNLSEVRNLRDGQPVTFVFPLPVFTQGKAYRVRKTNIGAYITDDNGMGIPLANKLYLEMCFRPTMSLPRGELFDEDGLLRKLARWTPRRATGVPGLRHDVDANNKERVVK